MKTKEFNQAIRNALYKREEVEVTEIEFDDEFESPMLSLDELLESEEEYDNV